MSARELTAQFQPDPNSSKSLIRQGYIHLLGDYMRIEGKSLMFNNDARPKAKFTMWLHLHGRMRIANKLLQWGMDVNPICSLCQSHNETRKHLFVVCEYTRNVWKKVLHWLGRSALAAGYLHWAVHAGRGKSQQAKIFRLIFAEVVHAVWIERNARIFEDRRRHWQLIAKETAYVSCVRAPPGIRILAYKF
ncbi:uncharacterized protein LOC132053979 [Lycium ferocissimum]|uniref:uncharacterized protein LOC132053979 n=1 Tax=Lycium ferocissimum TaxID=112874 RepID=UPI002814BC98|nr:uncharacterized protein LOC132053979 [Lycium ferocissimum]